MIRRLLLGLAVLGPLAFTGCSFSHADTTTGNMALTDAVAAPAHQRWFTGQLTVEPAGPDRACLLLVTPHGSFALRPTSRRLVPVAWEAGGQFDATHSGIARGRRLVAPYSQSRTSVHGAQVAKADEVCSSHPVLAFTAAKRGRHGGPHADQAGTPTSPATPTNGPTPTSPTSIAAQGGGPSLGGVPEPTEQWLSGRLILVKGNQNHGDCLALDTSAGAYTLGSSTNRYDVVVSYDGNSVNPRTTGIHIHGRTDLGMARLLGQHAEIRGEIMPGTDDACSRYHTFAMTALR